MSSPSSSCTTIAERKSLFQRAFEKYLQGLSGKTRDKDFFAQCYDGHSKNLTPDDINAMLQASVGERWLRHSTTRKVLLTLAAIQKEFDGVVNAITAFDPTPISGAAWACVTALANFVDRYFKVSDTIADALVALGDDLRRIATYDRLFGESSVLEDVLCQSYVDIFHFWSRVYQELHRPRAMKVVSALVSLRSAKLEKIIANMRSNAERVEEQTKLVKRERAQQEKLVRSVRDFLGPPLPTGSMSATERRLLGSQYAQIEDQCCNWIFTHSIYEAWKNAETPSPALWVYAPPGAGKSVLCQRVADVVREDSAVAVAAHYFRFDQNFTTLEVLKSLAAQLWEPCLVYHSSYDFVEKLARFAEDRTGDPTSRVLSILHELVRRLPAVYLFLDGVDEEVTKVTECTNDGDPRKNALGVLGVLNDLVVPKADAARNIRLWISSQNVAYTRQNFRMYTPFDIKDAVRTGIKCYLTRSVGSITVIPPEQQEVILHQLLARVESNFLWAHLIVVELKKATSLAELDEILEAGRAGDLDAYYRRFFDKFLQSSKASLARDVFSLVAFARRPLKVVEIQEALAILRSPAGSLEDSRKPFLTALLELFSPFIEVQNDSNTSLDQKFKESEAYAHSDFVTLASSCRLFHSSLFDFLRRHADVICENDEGDEEKPKQSGFRVCPLRIADACLLYLTQARYSALLRRSGDDWVDTNGQAVSEHQFLTYSAKNWDKHLDLVAPNGADLPFSSLGAATSALAVVAGQFRPRVLAFLTSRNFQTCIQIQSLWIVGAFSPYKWRNWEDGRVWVRRSLPRWIIEDNYCRDYHRFWWDWQKYLSCVGCDDLACPFRQCIGEVDRCWWGSLGTGNFLSGMESRYRSFRFEAPITDEEAVGRSDFQIAVATRDSVKALRLTSVADSQLNFVVESWSYSTDLLPILQRSQTLTIPLELCHASHYAVGDPNTSTAYIVCAAGGAPIASFNTDGRCLRIGTQVFYADSHGEYKVFEGIDAEDEDYIEEVAAYDGVVAVTSRRFPRVPVAKPSSAAPSQEATLCGDEDSDSEWADSDDEADSDSSSVSTDQGYETSSSCSSADEDEDAGDDSDSDSSCSSDEQEEEQDSSDEEDAEEEAAQEEDDGDSVYADSDDGVDPSTFAFGQVQAYGDQDTTRRRSRNARDPNAPPDPPVQQAYMQVFTDEGRLFRFRRKTSDCLVDSAPALHPTEPLVVWPLSGRELLFADYEDNTYFVREIGESSDTASNSSIKCHFAKSGRHLHIAIFETRTSGAEEEAKTAHLTLLVHTYRLCSSKPTRSPPTRIYTAQVDLGVFERAQLSPKLPCTLTWDDTHLYASWSGMTLLVHRIPLFSPPKGTEPSVNADPQCQRETILLPASAEHRDVFFFPARDRACAQVIVGGLAISEKRAMTHAMDLAAPVGCLLQPDDLGEWISAGDGLKRKGGRGAGQLNVALEQFDPDVDCVLEPFLWQG